MARPQNVGENLQLVVRAVRQGIDHMMYDSEQEIPPDLDCF